MRAGARRSLREIVVPDRTATAILRDCGTLCAGFGRQRDTHPPFPSPRPVIEPAPTAARRDPIGAFLMHPIPWPILAAVPADCALIEQRFFETPQSRQVVQFLQRHSDPPEWIVRTVTAPR